MGMHDLTALQDKGKRINVVFEDGYQPADVLKAEVMRKQYGLSQERALYGAGSAFIGPRRALETAYKACYFHDGALNAPENPVETMKICLNNKMKQSIPGLINWFYNETTGMYMLGCHNEKTPDGYRSQKDTLYDGISNPGTPYFNPAYSPSGLTSSAAIQNGIARTNSIREKLGPDFTRQVGENQTGIAMTKALREKRKAIYKRALQIVRKKNNDSIRKKEG
jgi:hypothetical protein